MPDFLLALDQGTTSSRAILFTRDGTPRATAQKELRQVFPGPAGGGWVEHDPMDIWQTQLDTARQVIGQAGIAAGDIAAIGITNQRETTLLWDRATGLPLHNAIVWQDRRTADVCAALRQSHGTLIQQKTGLIPDAYFSASKLQWLLDHVPGARKRAARGELAFGTVDTWLLWNLTHHSSPPTQSSVLSTHHAVHATDPSNASRTMLFNIHTCQWDDELLALFDIPREVLPEVRDSAGLFGTTSLLGPGREIPITGIAGDQQAALFGQACFTPGMAKNTYGTGCFLLMNTGPKAPISKNRLLSTIAWRIPNDSISQSLNDSISHSPNDSISHSLNGSILTYALEGSVFVGGALVQWLRDGLGIIQSAADIEPLASSVPDSGGIYIVPAFAGLGAPQWDPYARGTILGITRSTTKAHFARAALEAIAFQVADLLDAMHADLPETPIVQLRVDGGAAQNNVLLQLQADFLQKPVVRSAITETTALGAALLAGVGGGFLRRLQAPGERHQASAEYHPSITERQATERRQRWREALARSRNWETGANTVK